MSNAITHFFLREFIHADLTIGTGYTEAIAKSSTPRRIITVIQNKSATETITVTLHESATTGITLPPGKDLSIDNYNGSVRIKSTGAGTPVHFAYSVA